MSASEREAATSGPGAAKDLLREYLASLAFRFRHVTDGAPEEFGSFEAGAGVRTPAAIVLHMTGLLLWARDQLDPAAAEKLTPLSFDAECARFLAAVRDLDRVLAAYGPAEFALAAAAEPSRTLSFGQLWRGPLTDAMTHIGQLATLRRLAGDPVDRVRYWQVEMPPVR